LATEFQFQFRFELAVCRRHIPSAEPYIPQHEQGCPGGQHEQFAIGVAIIDSLQHHISGCGPPLV